jgi:hypothetical protein
MSDIRGTQSRSDRKLCQLNCVGWEFFAELCELLFRDPSGVVLFDMGHLYFGGFVEPSPSDAGVENSAEYRKFTGRRRPARMLSE